MRNDLGIGLGGEVVTGTLQLGTQGLMVLDDAIVHHRQTLTRLVGMGIFLAGTPMGRPAGMRDAAVTTER